MEEKQQLTINRINHLCAEFRRSRKALAIPMTFLILFVSTLGLISATYYLAVERVNARSQTLKITTAKQDLLSLDESIMSTVWQPGSARTIDIADSGGKLNVQPAANLLTISLTDNRDVNETVYNGTIGQVAYELPYAESPDTGLFLKGDSRTVTNQSGSIITQLYIASGVEHAEIHLRYRPAVSYIAAGTEENRAVNNLRIYVVNMNNSDSITLYGKLPLRISCESTQITRATYTFDYAIAALSVTSVIGGDSGQVSIPVSSTSDGAVVKVEIVQCNITVERSVL
jgi:hypothetical protein